MDEYKKENKIAPQNNDLTKSPNSKSMKFLPIVFTSQIARNRLDQMKGEMDKVKSMNPNQFLGM